MRDYAELIGKLRMHERRNEKSGYKCVAATYRNAADAIEELQRKLRYAEDHYRIMASAYEEEHAKVPQWVSVEERLPDDGDCYLCRIDCPNGKWLEVCKYTENQNFANFCNGEDATDFVTHWMPLPKFAPPKEDKP